MASLLPLTVESGWDNVDAGEIATTAASYITSEVQQVHEGFGGGSRYDEQLVQFVKPYSQLESALQFYLPTELDIECQGETWDTICEKINQTQKGYNESTKGFWHKIWYKMGDANEALDPWVALIPEAYGLAVVKVGLAVIFKFASNSAKKRQKIIDTFESLRDALIRTNPNRISFQGNQGVRDCCNTLYQTVVDAIEDMILATSKDKMSWRKLMPKFKDRTHIPDLDDVLKRVSDSTIEFELSLNAARDQTIESTAIMARYIGVGTTQIYRDGQKHSKKLDIVGNEVTATHSLVTELSTGMEQLSVESSSIKQGINDNATRITQEIVKIDKTQRDQQDLLRLSLETQAEAIRIVKKEYDQLNNKNNLLESLIDDVKKKDAEINRLKRQQTHQRQRPRKPLITIDDLFQILAQPNPFVAEPIDLRSVVQHPNKDFQLALVHKGRFKAAAQGQVQSLLRHERFIEWMSSGDHDLILVDADLQAARPGLSAMSVFCAEFVAGMIRVNPDDVVIHFFCALHMGRGDLWYGPNGLIRSIIMQLLLKLLSSQEINLEFVDNRDYLRALEHHDLQSLCSTLWEVMAQLPIHTTTYCIIDSISSFDRDATFRDMSIVLECLQNVVDDRSLVPTFKILMTNAMRSTRRMKEELEMQQNQQHHSRLVCLSSHKRVPVGITSRVIENHLLRASTPTPPRPLGRGHYQDDCDEFEERWNTN